MTQIVEYSFYYVLCFLFTFRHLLLSRVWQVFLKLNSRHFLQKKKKKKVQLIWHPELCFLPPARILFCFWQAAKVDADHLKPGWDCTDSNMAFNFRKAGLFPVIYFLLAGTVVKTPGCWPEPSPFLNCSFHLLAPEGHPNSAQPLSHSSFVTGPLSCWDSLLLLLSN